MSGDFRRYRLLLRCVAIGALLLPACGDFNGPEVFWPEREYIKPVMYWGDVGFYDWQPNRGFRSGYILQPHWIAADTILVHTGRFLHGPDNYQYGIFSVAIDPATMTFRNLRAYTYPCCGICDYDYDPLSRMFVLTVVTAPHEVKAVRARAVGKTLAIVDTVMTADWHPVAARFTSNADIILYARDPAASVTGFYLVSPDHPELDSLVYAVDLTDRDAPGFDVNGNTLCFGRVDWDTGRSAVWSLDLAHNSGARRVASFRADFKSVTLNSSGTCAIACFTYYDPGDLVGVLNLATGAFTKLDIRTHRAFFSIAEFPSWNPDETALAFSASGFSGEGDLLPFELWARLAPPCP